MCRYNPIEKLQHIHWENYQKPALTGMIAAGILVTITAVAFACIFSLHPEIFTVAADQPGMVTLAVVGGTSLVLFAIFSCMGYCGMKRERQNIENNQLINEVAHTHTTVQLNPITVSMDEQPVEYVKQVMDPIIDGFKEAIRGLVIANCVKTAKSTGDLVGIDGRPGKIETVFEEGKELFNTALSDPYIFVSELLRYYGPAKTSKTVAHRRLIAAFNADDPKILAQAQQEYEAVVKANNFSEIARVLRDTPVEKLQHLLREERGGLAELLKNRFSLPDETLNGLGQEILKYIFAKTQNHPEVLAALKKLKVQATNPTELAKEFEAFLKLVLDKANVSSGQYKKWNDILIRHMLSTTFKNTIRSVMNMVGRQTQMLQLMFDKSRDKDELFVTLDETFLLSESCDCIKNEALQKKIFHEQCKINLHRKANKRIALIALKKNDTRNYDQLRNEVPVIKLCFDANPGDDDELAKISKSVDMANLAPYDKEIRLVAVPMTMHDHPFKLMRDWEGTIKFVSAVAVKLFGRFLPGLVRPKVMEIVPKLEPSKMARFELFFEEILKILIEPIYDGAIGDTAFRAAFEEIITDKGGALAHKLEELVKKEDLSFEEIRDIWTLALLDVADAFKQVRRGENV